MLSSCSFPYDDVLFVLIDRAVLPALRNTQRHLSSASQMEACPQKILEQTLETSYLGVSDLMEL